MFSCPCSNFGPCVPAPPRYSSLLLLRCSVTYPSPAQYSPDTQRREEVYDASLQTTIAHKRVSDSCGFVKEPSICPSDAADWAPQSPKFGRRCQLSEEQDLAAKTKTKANKLRDADPCEGSEGIH